MYMLTLDTINFGSGWFPTLRKRPGCSGYYTVALGAGGAVPRARAVVARRAARARRARRSPTCSARTRRHELMELYAEALRRSAPSSASAARSTSSTPRTGRPSGWPSSSPPGCRSSTTRGFYKRAQIVPNDLALAGVAEFDDLDRLTIFADNLVPHVLRVDGVLATTRSSPTASTRGELLPPGARSARSAPAPSTPASRSPRELGVPAAHARHVAVEPRPGAALQGAPAAPDADRLLLRSPVGLCVPRSPPVARTRPCQGFPGGRRRGPPGHASVA